MNLAAARIGPVVAVLALSMALNGGPGAAQSPSGGSRPLERRRAQSPSQT